jgi:hypothetical protein
MAQLFVLAHHVTDVDAAARRAAVRSRHFASVDLTVRRAEVGAEHRGQAISLRCS